MRMMKIPNIMHESVPLGEDDSKNVEVQKGDTLYSISKKYKVPLRGIIEENNLSAPYSLKVGQVLNFPVKKTYVVEKGDTLYSISKKHDVDVLTLSKLNDLSLLGC